jgi:hypothetical protein
MMRGEAGEQGLLLVVEDDRPIAELISMYLRRDVSGTRGGRWIAGGGPAGL